MTGLDPTYDDFIEGDTADAIMLRRRISALPLEYRAAAEGIARLAFSAGTREGAETIHNTLKLRTMAAGHC